MASLTAQWVALNRARGFHEMDSTGCDWMRLDSTGGLNSTHNEAGGTTRPDMARHSTNDIRLNHGRNETLGRQSPGDVRNTIQQHNVRCCFSLV
jgi:hypothetical protein